MMTSAALDAVDVFRSEDGRLVRSSDLADADGAVWVDVHGSSPEQPTWMTEQFGTVHAAGVNHGEIEATSRYMEDDGAVRVQLSFLGRFGDTVTVAAALDRGRLVTYHEAPITAAFAFIERASKGRVAVSTGSDVLFGLVEDEVDLLADVLEDTYVRLEQLSRSVLSEGRVDLETVLVELAEIEGRNGQVRLSAMDAQRVLTSCSRDSAFADARSRIAEILRDVESLLTHSAFLLDGISFLSGTVMGLIGNTQNQVMKVLSIVAVVFLPPTLIASIYGMNFAHMPELSWTVGYPLSVFAMAALGVAPYWYAKRKGWL